jgi:hypothetical protein
VSKWNFSSYMLKSKTLHKILLLKKIECIVKIFFTKQKNLKFRFKKKLTWSSLWARPTLAGTSKSRTRSSNGCEFTFEVKIALAVIFRTLPVNCLLSGFHYFKLLRIVRILPTVASCLL